jgi:hypothetical protein
MEMKLKTSKPSRVQKSKNLNMQQTQSSLIWVRVRDKEAGKGTTGWQATLPWISNAVPALSSNYGELTHAVTKNLPRFQQMCNKFLLLWISGRGLGREDPQNE